MRVDEIVKRHAGLREFTALHPWFPSLLIGMLSNWISEAPKIQTKLNNLTNKEALLIGRALSAALEDRSVAESGVDMWINQYPALFELSNSNRFFVSMAVTIGKRKLVQAPWGLALKVGSGAVLSLLNVATDAYAIFNFIGRGKLDFAYATAGMIASSLLIQLLLVYAQNKKRGARVLIKESLIVLSNFKPAVIAFRVVSAAKAHHDDMIDPTLELNVTKMVEM